MEINRDKFQSGNLLNYLNSIPRDQWSTKFFKEACRNNKKNYDALVALCLQGVDFGNDYRGCIRDLRKDPRKLEIMVANGLNLKMKRRGHFTLLDDTKKGWKASAKVLIANGMRLDSSDCVFKYEDPNLIKFQQGVLCCRDVIVILIGLKKNRRLSAFTKIDRFLIKDVLAVEIWATRTAPAWRKQTLLKRRRTCPICVPILFSILFIIMAIFVLHQISQVNVR